jgi:hypothetical protein
VPVVGSNWLSSVASVIRFDHGLGLLDRAALRDEHLLRHRVLRDKHFVSLQVGARVL